jgi:glutamate carboxypeptidase
MKKKYAQYLDWITSQKNEMTSLLTKWANINSGSHNLFGLEQMLSTLKFSFSVLNGNHETIALPPGFKIDSKGQKINVPTASALRIKKHPQAAIQVFLGGHMDTVYGSESSFQSVTLVKDNILNGPGVADMKGGLIILLKSLEALERSPFAGLIGWEVLINPDEETGSQGSEHLFIEAAKRNHVALLFEPSFPDGAVVTSRKGSANFALVAKGRSAHAGRDFHLGCNAISAVARFITSIEKLNDPLNGTTINIGHIEGGGAINIVPDLAVCRFNVRTVDVDRFDSLRKDIIRLIEKENGNDGIIMTMYELASRGPKIYDEKNSTLFHAIKECALEMGITLEGRPSGGVCDGNIMSHEGVPTIDTLGVVGGNIHTHDEYAVLSSMLDRTTLVANFLMKLANRDIVLNTTRSNLHDS